MRIVTQLERLRMYFEERSHANAMMKTNQLETSGSNYLHPHLHLVHFFAVLMLGDDFVDELIGDLLLLPGRAVRPRLLLRLVVVEI